MLSPMLTTELIPHARVRPLRFEEFAKLIADGAFGDDERVELLYGVLYVKDREDMESTEHIWLTQRLMERLVLYTVGKQLSVICQSTVRMGDYHGPMPDVSVVAAQRGITTYPQGTRLVVEVAKSSLRHDRDTKAKIYAESNVPEYWLVDVEGERVYVFSDPHGPTYRRVDVVPRTGVLRSVALPGVEIAVDELFGGEA